MINFNNPDKINNSNSYSIISATLDNPFVKFKPDLAYGDFRSADPVLTSILPKNLNLGIPSSGFLDTATECTGLQIMNNNPDFDKLPFKVCLDKFSDQYTIPEMTFYNLLNNLPYTFSVLSDEQKKKYIHRLKTFVDTESVKNNIQLQDTIISDKSNDLQNKLDLHKADKIIEHFESENNLGNSNGNGSGNSNSKCNGDKSLKLNYILFIILIIILCIAFLVCFTKNK